MTARYKIREEQCTICGNYYIKKSPRSYFCSKCRVFKRREWKNKYAIINKEKIAKKRHAYDRTEKGKKKYERYRQTERYKLFSFNRYHNEKENIRKARYYVSNAVRDKKLYRPEICDKCGQEDWGKKRSMIEAHHHLGYSPEHWLDVQWLCTNCHKIADRLIKEVN